MKKMDLHIHTVSTKRDKPFAFSIEKLKGYVIQEKVDLIAITNHNLFDAQQFSDITNALPIKVFPGIEVDIEGGHLIVISQKNARKFIALTKQVKIHIFPKHNLWKYLMILENIS